MGAFRGELVTGSNLQMNFLVGKNLNYRIILLYSMQPRNSFLAMPSASSKRVTDKRF